MVKITPYVEEAISSAIEVHRQLGPGLLESVYEACLCRELELRKIGFDRQVPLVVSYKGHHIDCAYRMDIVLRNHYFWNSRVWR